MLFLARWRIILAIAVLGDDNLRFRRLRRFTERFKKLKNKNVYPAQPTEYILLFKNDAKLSRRNLNTQ